MDPHLVELAAGALAGLCSLPGHASMSDEEIGRRAAARARAAHAALVDAALEAETAPKAKPKGR